MKAQAKENRNRYKTLRSMLLRRRNDIKARIQEELGQKIAEDIDSVLGPALDEGDLSSLEIDRDVDYGVLTLYTKTLKNINQALERLEEGTYGICEECGRQIGEKRLQAMPFALYCVDCQRERERLEETEHGRTWMQKRVQLEEDDFSEDEYL